MNHFLTFILVTGLAVLCGCQHGDVPVTAPPPAPLVVPAYQRPVVPETPAIDSSTPADFERKDNGGLLYQVKEKGGWVITPHARDKYNALVAKWSTITLPPLVADAGISPYIDEKGNQLYLILDQYLVYFVEMNLRETTNRSPATASNQAHKPKKRP